MSTEKNAENAIIYNCESCNFKCYKKSNYDKHLNTRKHKKSTQINEKNAESIENNTTYICKCKKIYKDRTGLWKHKKICNENENENENENIIIEKCHDGSSELKTLTTIVLEIVKSNQELQKQMIDINKSTNNSNNIITTNNTNNNTMTNSNNKTFNLQVFLNEQCKDAMNLSDFMEAIQLSLEDLENMEKLGYTECMFKNIFGHMDFISIFTRPLHCSDFKRGIIYIKENGVWEKEDAGYTRLINAIRTVEKKNFKLLKEWTNKHPSFSDYNSPHNDKYVKIFGETMSGDKYNLNKLIRKLSKECVIDKTKL